MISVRRSALRWTAAVLAVVGVAAFAISHELARREASDFLDGQLRQIALNVGMGDGEEAGSADVRAPEDVLVINVWDARGMKREPRIPEIDIPRLPHPGLATLSAAGEDWRVCRVDRAGRIVQVAQRMAVQTEMVETAALEAGLPVVLAIPLAWLAINLGLARVFRRLIRVERDIAARGADSTSPIAVTDVPEEVVPLVQAMNALMGRILRAMERQRRFISDAAHELRTPLAALQIQINTLAVAEGAERDQSLADMEGGIRRAARLVDQLLRMARLDETRPPPRDTVDLTALVTQCVADFVPLAEAKGVDLGLVAADALSIVGGESELGMLFGTLIENAIRYTPVGGHVDVSIRRAGAAAGIDIVDTGCGIPDQALPHVFERFFRAAPAHIDGTGLGLSIAAAIARRYGLTIDLRNRAPNGLCVHVTIDRLILA